MQGRRQPHTRSLLRISYWPDKKNPTVTVDPADRLEHHLAREFVNRYITTAMGNARAVVIDPNKLFMAARMSGLRVSTKTLATVLEEMQQ